MGAVEKSLEKEKLRVERLKQKLVIEVEMKQQLSAERQETSKTANPQLAEGEDFHEGLRFKNVAISAKRNEWYGLAKEGSQELKTAEADVTLYLSPQEAALEAMNAHTAEITEL